jgi:hypothetical protein
MREKPTNTPIINSVYLLCMVVPTCFSITLASSGSVPSAFWEMLNWEAVDRILCMDSTSSDMVRELNILSTTLKLSISQKALGKLPEDGNLMPQHVGDTIHN